MSIGFWNDHRLEPKRGFRFILSIEGGTAGGIQQYLVKQVKKPSWSLGEATHQYLNHTFYFPGRVTWAECTFTIVDVVDTQSNGSKELMEVLEASGYSLPISPNNLANISKRKAVEALGSVKIRTIDAEGEPVEEWNLHNAYVSAAEFGELSYESDDMLNISVTMKYDNAWLNVMGPGGGKLPSNAAGAN